VHPGPHRLSEDVDRLLARLSAAVVSDRRVEWRLRISATLTIACIVAALLFLVVFAEEAEGGTVLMVVTTLGALIALFGWRWRVYRRRDLDDHKLQVVRQVLHILRADIPRAAPVTLTLDLRPYDRGGERIAGQGRVTRYRHAWLEATIPLADDNVLSLEVVDAVKRKTRRRGARVQWRTRVDLGLRLASRYGAGEDAARSLRQRGGPAPLGVVTVGTRRVRADGPARLEARLRTPVSLGTPPLTGDGLLAAVRWAYAGLAVIRRSA
jgi:hypothetical protein